MENDEVRKLTRQFKGIWIPASILHMEMGVVSKMLWADIDSFSGNGSTWFKSRERVAKEYAITIRTVSRSLSELLTLELIDMVKNDGRVRHYVAHLPGQIVPSAEPICPGREDNVSRETGQNVPIDNSIDKQKRKQIRVCTLDEAQEYMAHLGFGAEAEKFYDYYTANGWTQGRGKPIKDWKAAARNWTRNAKQFTKKERGFNPNNFTADGLGSFITDG